MTDKLTLNSISPTSSTTTAASTINANNAAIVAAMDNTLSLNGTLPNQMESNLDMNSNQVLNLPAPISGNSPARLVDVISNPTLVLTIPPVGTSGAVVGLLNTSNTLSGSNTFSGNNTFSGTNSFSNTTSFTNNVTISGSAPLALTSNSPGVSELGFQLHDPNMVSGNDLLSVVGRDETSFNRAQMGFHYTGANSANNHGWLGLYAADHIINWDGNGFVGIGTGNNTLTKLFTINTANNFSVDSSGNIIMAGGLSSSTASNFTINAASSQQVVLGAVGGTVSVVISGAGSPTVYPSSDNAMALGGGSSRWSNLYTMNAIAYSSLGFATGAGAGGTVTQGTSKQTGVTLNTPTGQITMNNASLTTGNVATFTLTNSSIGPSDVLVLNHVSGGTNVGKYCLNAQCTTGSAFINVLNNSGGALSEALVIGYVVVKGSTN